MVEKWSATIFNEKTIPNKSKKHRHIVTKNSFGGLAEMFVMGVFVFCVIMMSW